MDGGNHCELLVIGYLHAQVAHHHSVVGGIGAAHLGPNRAGVDCRFQQLIVDGPYRHTAGIGVAQHQGEAGAEVAAIGADLHLAVGRQGDAHRAAGIGAQGQGDAVAAGAGFTNAGVSPAGDDPHRRQGAAGDHQVVDGKAVVGAAVVRVGPAQPQVLPRRQAQAAEAAGELTAVGGQVAVQGPGAAAAHRGAETQLGSSCPACISEGAATDAAATNAPLQLQALAAGFTAVAPLLAAIAEIEGVEAAAGVIIKARSPEEIAGTARAHRSQGPIAGAIYTKTIEIAGVAAAATGHDRAAGAAAGGIPAGYLIIAPAGAAAINQTVEILAVGAAEGDAASGDHRGAEAEPIAAEFLQWFTKTSSDFQILGDHAIAIPNRVAVVAEQLQGAAGIKRIGHLHNRLEAAAAEQGAEVRLAQHRGVGGVATPAE